MRSRFERQLQELHDALTEMADQCKEAISHAAQALLSHDLALAKTIRDGDDVIDQQEREIEAMCLTLLLQQQPVARDLRAISTAMRMITDLERIGDQAADIAEIVLEAQGPSLEGLPHIQEMAHACVGMVSASVDAFVRRDLDAAQGVIAADDGVDALFCKVRQDLIVSIQNGQEHPDIALDRLMIAKYFERIGDHAVNLAEWVVYSITGAHPTAENGRPD